MKTNKQILLSALLTVLLCPLVSDAAAAQARRADPVGVRIDDLRVQVLEVGSRREIGWVEPGGTITLPEGIRVRLIMTATGVNGKTFYPYTEFSDPSRGGVRISKSSEENANATLEVPRGKGREWTSSVRFQITEKVNLPAAEKTGHIHLRVVPEGQWSGTTGTTGTTGSGASWSTPGTTTGGTWSNTAPAGYTARDLAQALYRGILLRDLDENGARGYISTIQRNGYNGVVSVARDIAASQESRALSSQRNAERLETLYQQLLGMSRSNVSQSQWDYDLRRLNSGDIAGVVDDILRSDRFLDYYRLDN